MKNPNQHISISNKEVYPRSYFLRKKYKELVYEVRQSGGDIWAEFIVEILPNGHNDISIELIEAADKEDEYISTCFSKGVTKGVRQFKSELNYQDIGISGMNFRITNLSYHPIDSKPSGYTYPLVNLLKRLRNTDLFGMQINHKSHVSSIHNSKIIDYEKNVEKYILAEIQFQIVSPKCFANTLVLRKRIEAKIRCKEEGLERWKITIAPKSEYDRKLYTIDVEFRDKFESDRKYKTTRFSISIYQCIEQIVKEFQLRKINIAGFYLLVEPLYNWENESFVSPNIEQIKWIIFSSLLDENISINRIENL